MTLPDEPDRGPDTPAPRPDGSLTRSPLPGAPVARPRAVGGVPVRGNGRPGVTLPAFRLAGGSVAGRDHVRVGRNNQDAFAWTRGRRALVAIACDGCGSGEASEVGARLGASLLVARVLERLERGEEATGPRFWESVRADALAQLRVLAHAMGGTGADALARVVERHFLFTVVGVALTPVFSTAFALGDGLIVVDGERFEVGPFPGNAPPYLGYGLLDPGSVRAAAADLAFRLVDVRPTRAVDAILLGTDGALDLEAAADRTLPGKRETVGPLARLWTDERFVDHPDALRRRLALTNREVARRDPATGRAVRAAGLLPDDTTVVVVRRAAAADPPAPLREDRP